MKATRRQLQRRKSQIVPKKSPLRILLKKFLIFLIKAWKWLVAAGLLITILTGYYFDYPRLEIETGDVLVPKNPFHTPFIIKNTGYFPIKNIKWICFLDSTELEGGGKIVNIGLSAVTMERAINIKKLYPQENVTLEVSRLISKKAKFIYAEITLVMDYEFY